MRDWWRGSVTCQVCPRSFQDDSGDGVGDLKGITRRLPLSTDGCRCLVARPGNGMRGADLVFNLSPAPLVLNLAKPAALTGPCDADRAPRGGGGGGGN